MNRNYKVDINIWKVNCVLSKDVGWNKFRFAFSIAITVISFEFNFENGFFAFLKRSTKASEILHYPSTRRFLC